MKMENGYEKQFVIKKLPNTNAHTQNYKKWFKKMQKKIQSCN